jgi:hypothetical protein
MLRPRFWLVLLLQEEVGLGDDAYQASVAVHDRESAHRVLIHEASDLLETSSVTVTTAAVITSRTLQSIAFSLRPLVPGPQKMARAVPIHAFTVCTGGCAGRVHRPRGAGTMGTSTRPASTAASVPAL